MTDTGTNLARALPYIGMGGVVLGNVIANLFMKLGSNQAAAIPGSGNFLTLPTFIGIAIFGASVLLYAWVLKYLPLYLAQSMAALQFVGVIMTAALFFGEPIIMRQWLGFALIMLGLAVVAG
jgi:multidrug transporter EmrE-like cation transporter